ncbi:hypothetical protein [Parasitella parasitica]|uniref:Uncharacterized protein n=1 Tax=Parasitella parasitica TaxID=35722 RepID=A0A0B7N739_9FUNG|nr:hypothetical protein [Parasitella parasitica]
MCLQSSCILSKTIGASINTSSNCNTTQFGTRNLYNWYDYCLSSENDNNGKLCVKQSMSLDYCATSTECYQYRKSAGPSVTYAWHNLTCNPNTCMLIASNGAPPPVPVPPQPNGNTSPSVDLNNKTISSNDASEDSIRHRYHHTKFRNPSAIALTVVCSLITLVAICWIIRLFIKKGWWPFNKDRLLLLAAVTSKRRCRSQRQQEQQQSESSNSISSIPGSAPPSFSSIPPDMTTRGHPHLQLYTNQPSTHSGRSSTASSSNNEPLPSYLSPYPTPPKYEQAIVTQIRGLREEESSSSSSSTADQYHRDNAAPIPSMWVPVYFTQQPLYGLNSSRQGNNQHELFGFTPNHPVPHYWMQQFSSSRQLPLPIDNPRGRRNPFDDDQQIDPHEDHLMKVQKSPTRSASFNSLSVRSPHRSSNTLSPLQRSSNFASASRLRETTTNTIGNTTATASSKRKHTNDSSPFASLSRSAIISSMSRSDTFSSEYDEGNPNKWTKEHWRKLEQCYIRKNRDYERAANEFYYLESLQTMLLPKKDSPDGKPIRKELWSKEQILWRCKCLDTSAKFHGGVLPSERKKIKKSLDPCPGLSSSSTTTSKSPSPSSLMGSNVTNRLKSLVNSRGS